jgi:hypothetical protein
MNAAQLLGGVLLKDYLTPVQRVTGAYQALRLDPDPMIVTGIVKKDTVICRLHAKVCLANADLLIDSQYPRYAYYWLAHESLAHAVADALDGKCSAGMIIEAARCMFMYRTTP